LQLPSPVKRILQLDEEQDVTSRLEEVRAVLALHHSATVLFCWRLSMLSSSSPSYPWPGRVLATLPYRCKNSGRMMKSKNSPYFL
jgi:hypothetical protein